ncbi:MAG TPA: ester cyclase [Caulobacteraceae bacterium]|jgi:ketosteroid isomerase-like protein
MAKWISGLVVTLALAAGTALAEPSLPPAEPAPKDTPEANTAQVRALFAAFNAGDLASINRIMAPDLIFHSPSGDTARRYDPPQDLKSACPMCDALKNRKVVIDLILAEGDLVAVRATWRGTFSSEFHGVKVSGKSVTIPYENIFRFRGGRIRENWASADGFSLMHQLGFTVTPPR